MAGPLSDITVLDLSRILAGPWSTQFFADLGAEVIKIERPVRGDDTRSWGPPYLRHAETAEDTTESAYFLSANRGKKSVAIDMAAPEGQRLIRELALQADVVVENFKVGGLQKYGLDYEGLSAVNPRLIYCSITGFGQTGPYAKRAGYDLLIQGMSGLMSLTGTADGEPQKTGIAICDLMTGMYASSACLAALHARENSGRGQHIDLALFDTAVAWLANQGMNFLCSGNVPSRMGNAHPSLVPYQILQVADGEINLAVGNDSQFRAFAEISGHPEWADDERFSTNPQRVAHREELLHLMQPVLKEKSRAWWQQACEERGVPAGPINSIGDSFADPQIQARGMELSQPHPLAGTTPGVANPIRFSDTPIDDSFAPPLLGQHTAAVLQQKLDLPSDEIKRLAQQGVVGVMNNDT